MGERDTKPAPPPVAGVSEIYARGLRLFVQESYNKALATLEPLAERADLAGVMARFYRGLCWRGLGVRALIDGRLEKAEEYLNSAQAILGRRSDLYGYLASVYALTGRHEVCASAAEKAARYAERDCPAVRRRCAQALWRAGRRAEAHMVLAESLRVLGRRSELLIQQGLFFAAEEHRAEAREALAEACKLNGADPNAHYYLGLAAAADKDPVSAVSALQRAVELRPGDVLVTWQLSLAVRAAAEAGKNVTVRVPEPERICSPSGGTELARYVAAEPDFVDAFLSLPESDVDAELFGLLAEVLTAALDEHPNYADLHRGKALVLERLGRREEAETHLHRALSINPDYLAARLDMARMCRLSGRTAEALSHLGRVLAAGGDWPDVHCMVGRLLRHRGRHSEARRHLQRAIELNPHYREAAEELESLAA